ncbi:DUF2312 domain-containing protein [Parvibaculum sp.]|uniref:DUF2312 domain-containing protein n=1 Tax=Parvibaculum sp. TaxID=2024848 RepID=UPI00391DEB50
MKGTHMLGKNTANGKILRGYIEEIERIRADKKELNDDEKAIFASANAAGYSARRLREVLKIRTMKPADRQEAEAQLQMYLHAIGMDQEAPLYRHVGLMAVDKTVKSEVIEAFKQLVPHHGDITVNMGGAKVRLWRDKDGEAHAEDVIEAPQDEPLPLTGGGKKKAKKEVPECDEDGAFRLGNQAAKDNEPVIANPFPFGDPRRARWDEGWRSGAGSDGMGPDTSKKPGGDDE